MSIIESTTGHSRKKERKVAKILFLCIGIAVILGLLFSLLAGGDKSLSPLKSETPSELPQ